MRLVASASSPLLHSVALNKAPVNKQHQDRVQFGYFGTKTKPPENSNDTNIIKQLKLLSPTNFSETANQYLISQKKVSPEDVLAVVEFLTESTGKQQLKPDETIQLLTSWFKTLSSELGYEKDNTVGQEKLLTLLPVILENILDLPDLKLQDVNALFQDTTILGIKTDEYFLLDPFDKSGVTNTNIFNALEQVIDKIGNCKFVEPAAQYLLALEKKNFIFKQEKENFKAQINNCLGKNLLKLVEDNTLNYSELVTLFKEITDSSSFLETNKPNPTDFYTVFDKVVFYLMSNAKVSSNKKIKLILENIEGTALTNLSEIKTFQVLLDNLRYLKNGNKFGDYEITLPKKDRALIFNKNKIFGFTFNPYLIMAFLDFPGNNPTELYQGHLNTLKNLADTRFPREMIQVLSESAYNSQRLIGGTEKYNEKNPIGTTSWDSIIPNKSAKELAEGISNTINETILTIITKQKSLKILKEIYKELQASKAHFSEEIELALKNRQAELEKTSAWHKILNFFKL